MFSDKLSSKKALHLVEFLFFKWLVNEQRARLEDEEKQINLGSWKNAVAVGDSRDAMGVTKLNPQSSRILIVVVC